MDGIVTFSLMFGHIVSGTLLEQIFHTSSHYVDRTPSYTPIAGINNIHTDGITMCAILCLKDNSCQSFSFTEISGECRGYSVALVSPSDGIKTPGISSQYFTDKNNKTFSNILVAPCTSDAPDGEPRSSFVYFCLSTYTYNETLNLCYKYNEGGSTWTSANKTCYSDGGYLFKMNTSAKYQLLKEQFSGYTFPEDSMEVIWIQGQRDSEFKWYYDDGTLLTDGFTIWNQFGVNIQPSNGTNETALVAFPTRDMSMMDADPYYYDTKPQPFLCEIPL